MVEMQQQWENKCVIKKQKLITVEKPDIQRSEATPAVKK